jgi:hypothetical protein
MNYKKFKSLINKSYIPVTENSDNDESYFEIRTDNTDPIIVVGTKGSDTNYLFTTIVHEFGHYLSSKSTRNPKYYKAMDVYDEFGADSLTNKQKEIIIEEERSAWFKGERFAKRNGFKLDHEFYLIKQRCLNGYYYDLQINKRTDGLKNINWDVFFGDPVGESVLMYFAAGKASFKEFEEMCAYSKERSIIIRCLKVKGYDKAMKMAQAALNYRGYKKK